ncbi:MAG: response regulator [Proteobacteria bacterium]|nr:response regulator [Pseudomonadota bacterium]
MSKQKIFIVEDEIKIAQLIRDYLEDSNFSTIIMERGDLVIQQIKKDPPDLILMDIMLPGANGMDICKEIRKFSNLPVIMITARVEEIDRLVGLELGADDYICKPFSPREVVARVKAVLRRTQPKTSYDKLVAGPIILEESTRKVTVHNNALQLTPNEFGLLKILMTNPDQVFSRNELLNKVQGYNYDGYDRTIDTHIKNLRKKISAHLSDEDMIISVYGVGYKLKASF